MINPMDPSRISKRIHFEQIQHLYLFTKTCGSWETSMKPWTIVGLFESKLAFVRAFVSKKACFVGKDAPKALFFATVPHYGLQFHKKIHKILLTVNMFTMGDSPAVRCVQ